ncbi:MAG: type II toxin-antitoxin system HicB family antitoxin [Lachnospiraceae bacterium]|nr:type II toxin-antitoxin system HicB family antitoxin [Lachnospiraceae bacterium]
MKFTYPAIFKKTEDGGYEGRFVDLAGCRAVGYDLDNAVRNLIEEEADWIRFELSEEDPSLPPVTDLEDVETGEGEIALNVAANVRFYDGWDE